jgi:hypothetical protein
VGTESDPIIPRLDSLADNGGPTQTHALQIGSPALNTGNPAVPGSGGNACEPTDQRGFLRPADGNCDIGAFERNAVPPVINTRVTFVPDQSTIRTLPVTSCPSFAVGEFHFSATLTNISTSPVSDLLIQVAQLTNGNQILIQPFPNGRTGVEGAILEELFRLSPLVPGDHYDVQFVICLANTNPFSFFVDVLGTVR